VEPEELPRIECRYCGRVLEMSEEVKMNLETGEYEYVCPSCAKMFSKEEGKEKS
jgi:DNA-directed RNA polymerase subunit RPC12/RpoP